MSYSIMLAKGDEKMNDQVLDNLINELRRGTQMLFVLDALEHKQYGYSLLSELESKKVAIEAGTLYPLLRRLDEQGLLDSEWDTTESRPRKYYVLSDKGKDTLSELKKEWVKLTKELSVLFKEDNLR